MSAQVAVVPAASVRAGLKPVSARATSTSTSSNVAAKLSRFRQPPPKPEIEVDKAELKKKLTPMQYQCTMEKFTERAFSGEYVKLNEDGKYCCIVCGVEIFSSDTKFDSGCGWPAFSDVIDSKKVIQQADLSHVGGNLLLLALNQDLARTEVSCAKCGAHLGHVFDDGPKPSGKRYCVNSASLCFKKEDQSSCDESKQSVDLKPKSALVSVAESTKLSNDDTQKKSTVIEAPREGKLLERQQGSQVSLEKVKAKEVTPVEQKTASTRSTDAKTAQGGGSTWRVEWRPSRIFSGSSKSARINHPKSGATAVESVPSSTDANNNRIAKYNSVKSRYLDHLNTASKQEAEKHTAKSGTKPLLETHL